MISVSLKGVPDELVWLSVSSAMMINNDVFYILRLLGVLSSYIFNIFTSKWERIDWLSQLQMLHCEWSDTWACSNSAKWNLSYIIQFNKMSNLQLLPSLQNLDQKFVQSLQFVCFQKSAGSLLSLLKHYIIYLALGAVPNDVRIN